jgi:hypothetical protein
MHAVLNQTPFMPGRVASALSGRRGRGRRTAGSAPGPGNPLSGWLRSLPFQVHLIPYGALLVLGVALLSPGVVPHGPGCDGELGAASAGTRELFTHVSAAAFGLIAGLLLLSALVASAQRRGGRPGAPTITAAALFGAVTLAAVAWPHAPIAAPVQAVIVIDVVALVLSCGAALIVPLVAAGVAWRALRGLRTLRVAQIAAWTTLLLALPLVMAATYLTVTPICFN